MERAKRRVCAGRVRRRPLCVAVSLLLMAVAAVTAPPCTASTDAPESTPRSAMEDFLTSARAGNFVAAAASLDLRGLRPAAQAERGPQLARQLKVVLDRALWIDLDTLSDVPEGEPDDGLPARRELLGTIARRNGSVPILLEHVRDSGGPVWKIAASSVAQIPGLYDELGYGRLGEYLPPLFFRIRFLEVELWQWAGLLLLGLGVALLSWLMAQVVVRLIRPLVTRTTSRLDDELLELAQGPVGLLLGFLIYGAGAYPLGLAVPVQAVVTTMVKVMTIVAITWFVVRLANVLAHGVENELVARGQVSAKSMVPLGKRAIQLAVAGLAVLAVLQNFGVNVTGILAGLGIGGLAVALAAQKSVENLFGGITLIADQPVRVGDFCRFGDRVGTVEEVGLRSTRVRTLERTMVTIPNAEFSALQLENFSRRDRIWFHPTIGLRYETTPDQLRYVLVELKKLLVSHPKVDPNPARPRFVRLGDYSLDIEIFAYVLTADMNEFLAVQEDLLLRIMDVVAASGSGFAFPSQTIYAAGDGGLNAETSRAVEAQVEKWRAANNLGVPSLKPEELAALRATLDYPPRGSATAD